MSRNLFVKRFGDALTRFVSRTSRTKLRSPATHFNGLEYLEGRSLLTTINASAVISAAPTGADFNYSINLTNASTSDTGVGTFWFAWVPGKNFLATRPLSVTPPAGWTDTITHQGDGDGFAIQFVATSAANGIQPGGSLNFSFTSADTPASIVGNSAFESGTPAATSFVYPGAPFSDAGHQFVATLASSTPPPPVVTPLVTLTGVTEVKNKKHLVNELVIGLSGSVNAIQARNVAAYQLTAANARGSFSARNSPVIKLSSALYDAANHTITLTLRKPIASSKPAELIVDGSPPSGLQDSSGRLIDGDHDGTAGGNAFAVIRNTGVVLNPAAPRAPNGK